MDIVVVTIYLFIFLLPSKRPRENVAQSMESSPELEKTKRAFSFMVLLDVMYRVSRGKDDVGRYGRHYVVFNEASAIFVKLKRLIYKF